MLLRAQTLLAYFFTLLLASVLAFTAGYQLCDMQHWHTVTVQEITERQADILEDVWELRWRVDSLEVWDGVNRAEIRSLKGKWLDDNGMAMRVKK